MAKTLSSVAVVCPATVNESTTGKCMAKATFSDNSSQDVTTNAATWSATPAAYATIGTTTGALKALAVTANQVVTVTANYTYNGGVQKSGTALVTIKDVPLGTGFLQAQMPITFQENNFGWAFTQHADYSAKSCGGTYYVYHPGADLNAVNDASGTVPVVAIADGRIVIKRNTWLGLVIKHTDADGKVYYSQYGHIKQLTGDAALDEGKDVLRGQQIGFIGAVGATDPDGTTHYHLHFSIRTANEKLLSNPEDAEKWWGNCGVEIDSEQEVFNRYVSPLSFVREREDPTVTRIIVDDSMNFAGIENYIDAQNRVVNAAGEIVKERFFRGFGFQVSQSGGESVAFEGGHRWAKTTSGAETAAGKWSFDIPALGRYEVFVSVPSKNATSKLARYEVNHDGLSEFVTIDQAAVTGTKLSDRWRSLGIYTFRAGNMHYVRLSNATGEAGLLIGFDAVKLERRP